MAVRHRWVTRALIKVLLVLIFLSLAQVLALKYIAPPFTINMVWERLRHHWFEAPMWRTPMMADLPDIPLSEQRHGRETSGSRSSRV